MSSKKEAVITDLGVIRVMTTELKDTIVLAHNGLKAFTVTCRQGKPSDVKVNPKFVFFDDAQIDQVIIAYLKWKREHMPSFKMPNHLGQTKSGKLHPWRARIKRIEKRIEEQTDLFTDDDGDEATEE